MSNPLTSFFPIHPDRLVKLCDERIAFFKTKMDEAKAAHEAAVEAWKAQDGKHSRWARFIDGFRDRRKIPSKPLWHTECDWASYYDSSEHSKSWRAFRGCIDNLNEIKHRARNVTEGMVYLNRDDTDSVHGGAPEIKHE